jgi:hypothetical protein
MICCCGCDLVEGTADPFGLSVEEISGSSRRNLELNQITLLGGSGSTVRPLGAARGPVGMAAGQARSNASTTPCKHKEQAKGSDTNRACDRGVRRANTCCSPGVESPLRNVRRTRTIMLHNEFNMLFVVTGSGRQSR